MINIKGILKNNLLLKMTSLNAVVIIARLIVSVVVQRLLAVNVGEVGIAKIGQLRNLIQILTSTSSFGIFNGIVKYVSENENNKSQLTKLFSTAFILTAAGSILSTIIIYTNAHYLSIKLFGNSDFIDIVKCLSFVPILIGINRVLYGLINGLSDYKKYAKIDLGAYLLSVVLLLVFLYFLNLKGVLFSILLTPIISFGVIIMLFYKKIKLYIVIKELKFEFTYLKPLMSFALMSFISTVLSNYIELDIRTTITDRINIDEAGYWTAMNFISKNYMVFSSSIFTLYVIPKFAKINDVTAFKKEVIHIYKTLLPLFGLGMIAVYIFRTVIVDVIYPNFDGLVNLFKWQLLGDFIRLATLVISYQFLAKKMVWSFVITELVSLGLFYVLSKHFVDIYGAEGVVMAHFYRYIIYFPVVIFTIWYYFKTNKRKISDV